MPGTARFIAIEDIEAIEAGRKKYFLEAAQFSSQVAYNVAISLSGKNPENGEIEAIVTADSGHIVAGSPAHPRALEGKVAYALLQGDLAGNYTHEIHIYTAREKPIKESFLQKQAELTKAARKSQDDDVLLALDLSLRYPRYGHSDGLLPLLQVGRIVEESMRRKTDFAVELTDLPYSEEKEGEYQVYVGAHPGVSELSKADRKRIREYFLENPGFFRQVSRATNKMLDKIRCGAERDASALELAKSLEKVGRDAYNACFGASLAY